MRWQTTAILAVILLALASFYYVYEVRLGPEREQAEARKGRVLSAELGDVTEVRIERPGETVHVKREAEAWQMLEPVKARGDRSVIDDLVTTAVTAKSDREINAAPSPESLKDFGLEKPAATVTFTLKDGKQTGLVLGGKTPTGAWVYARQLETPAVLAIGETVLRDATRPVADYRDKTILAVDRKDVTGLEIATRDDTLVLEQKDGKWVLTEPRGLAADGDTIREFFDKLTGAKVREFVAEAPPSLAMYGLDRPTRLVVHTGKDKDRATRTLLFGRADSEKKGVYAMRHGESSVLLIPDDVWTALPKTVATAREKTIVPFDRDKLTALEIESDKGHVKLVRENETWKIVAPETLPADQPSVGGVLFKLRDLKAQAFLSEDASGIPRFLSKPAVTVTVTEQGANPRTVLLAPSPEKRGGQPSAYAGVAGHGPVVLVEGTAVNDLSRSLTDLRDRTLVSGFEPKDVKRIRFSFPDQVTVVERTGDAEWRVIEPAKGNAKSGKIEDLLYTLRGGRWREIVAPAGQDAAKYGLDKPSLEATFLKGDGSEIATLALGRREGDRVFARTKAGPAIYALDAKALGDLPKTPDDLKG
jgi:hypothetical protein